MPTKNGRWVPSGNLQIEGRRHKNLPWGTIDALLNANADASSEKGKRALEAVANEKLQEWKNHSNDREGAFAGWQFRIAQC